MQMMLMVADAVAETVGSLIAAALLCWLLWEAFKVLRHPAWAIGAVLLLSALAIIGALPKSEFLNMAIAFAAMGSLPLWIEGRAWRKRRMKEQANGQKRAVI